MKMVIEERARDSADNCLACTSCIANCPVTEAERKYKGPKFVGPAHNRMHFSDANDVENTLDFCSNCKNCDISCPSGVPISTLNMLAKSKLYKTKKHSLLEWILAHSDIISKLPVR